MKTSEIIPYKEKLFNQQNGICPLCSLPLIDVRSSHLDHDHSLSGINEGRCRGLLHPQCNTLEGTILHKFNRSGLKFKADYITYLENLVEYLKADYSSNEKHPQWARDKLKWFSKLTIKEMLEVFPDATERTKKELINRYRKLLKEEPQQ
ncbi:endonuclease domain-containing protein [Serratia ureilytica]|uniref:endonuclease domain-containing protein n=1 Tax=Serratia ureilytica TaxID=300181 RepID=UPI0019CF7B8E|nr:endonuclease domain-containing protein [Serratia ureilytica]MBN5214266.1 endonuclease VII [Serratia ureilytica]